MNKKTLLQLLEEVPDCRSGNAIRHCFKDILMIGLLCVICNGDTFTDMELFGQTHEDQLRKFLSLPYGIPSHDVFRSVFEKLEPEALKKRFGAWTQTLKDEIECQAIGIDGKTIRGSYHGEVKAKHVVSAFASDMQLVLGQLGVDEKSNEITAIPKLLEMFCVKGNIITIDAMGTQKEIARAIHEKEGYYVLALKENHPALYEDIRLYFDQDVLVSDKKILKCENRYAHTCEKGHGRIETRECFLTDNLSWLAERSQWPGLVGAACIRAKRILLPGGHESISERLFLFSCPDMTADRLLSLQRGHWAIENQLHWCLDVTFHEDDSRARMENAAEVLDILRKLALQLMKQETSVKGSLRNKRLRCGYDLFLPSYCVVDEKKYYQFTAKDECSRWTYREMYDEHSTYSARDFLLKLIKNAPFPIRLVQTDNSTEFTNALLVTKSKHKTLFEQALLELGIDYKRIPIATPRHNGKVERQHRTDELRFYRHMRMFGLEDGRKQLAVYQRESNNHIMTCLWMKSPNEVLSLYHGVMW